MNNEIELKKNMDTRLNEYNLKVNDEIDEQLKIAQNDYEKVTKDAMKDVEKQIANVEKELGKINKECL